MSSNQSPTHPPPSVPPPPTPRRRRPVTVSIIMLFFGVILLLPGLCALLLTPFSVSAGSGLFLLWLICLAISAGGIVLIAKAF